MNVVKNHKALAIISLLLFPLLLLPFVSSALPSSRNLEPTTHEKLSNHHHLHRELLQKKEFMSVEAAADYTGAGANNHHDPKSPPAR